MVHGAWCIVDGAWCMVHSANIPICSPPFLRRRQAVVEALLDTAASKASVKLSRCELDSVGGGAQPTPPTHHVDVLTVLT